MKAIKGLIAAIEGGIQLTLYRNSFDAIAAEVADLQIGSSGKAFYGRKLDRLIAALAKTSERFSREKFLASVNEYTLRYNNNEFTQS